MTALPVNNNQSATVTVSISNGPTSGTFLPSTGACTSFTNVNSVNCQTAPLTLNQCLSAQLANGNSCSKKICVLNQSAYRIWNTTGQSRDFRTPNNSCILVNDGAEITQPNDSITSGTSVTGYTSSDNTCNGFISSVDYNQAACTDDNGDGTINYNAGGSTSDR
jgi:hypothetical protein